MVDTDAGYGVSTPFRIGLEERGPSYVPALTGKEVAYAEEAEPRRPAYGGLGPPPLPRYHTPPAAVSVLQPQTLHHVLTIITQVRNAPTVHPPIVPEGTDRRMPQTTRTGGHYRRLRRRPVSHCSSGRGADSGCWTAKYSPIVRSLAPIRRRPS